MKDFAILLSKSTFDIEKGESHACSTPDLRCGFEGCFGLFGVC
jgi:hypothetical protein